MATKRPHRKTRNGCKPCKERRLKCDEQKPSCQRCRQKGVVCSFLAIAPSGLQSITAPHHPKPQSSIGSHPVPTIRSPPTNFASKPHLQLALPSLTDVTSVTSGKPELDRVLMRMFTDYTAGSLSDRPRGQRAWSENIPRLSLASPFVADGMLALAALHLAKLQSNGNAGAADSYLSMATNKLNKSLPIFRSALERMNDKNCDALFIFAAMIVVFLFATALEDCKTHLDSLTSLSDLPPNNNVRRRREFEIGSAMLARHVQTFQALRGSLFIITSYFPRLKMGPCSDICSRDFWPTDPIPEAMEKARADVLIDDHHLKSLQKLWQDERPEARSTLDKTLEDLRWSYALLSCISSGPSAATTSSLVIHTQNFLPNKSPTTSPIMDRSAVLAFPTTMLAEFSRLVDQHNKAALVLWTYYAVLLDRIGDIWWSKGIGKQNALAIALILGPESRKCLEWPMKSLGLDDIWL